jgi:hypothetical protein
MQREAPSNSSAEFAERGSQRWLQVAIQQRPDVLLGQLKRPLRLSEDETIEWRSPLRQDRFVKYRDKAALRQAGIEKLPSRSLNEFWPARGPVWDAIGVAGKRSIFVEAKAHIAKMASPGTKATPESGRQSRRRRHCGHRHVDHPSACCVACV